ncbi:MAG: enoyl-CoA hydratase/isomerase family protein, partial [Silicimonas sp.]|nr:enoyl-CoA hydratase/isomerase family protein [Silicimonas sp.]
DVGGSLLLARAPGRIGEYLGTTGHRMAAGDAIFAGFADYYLAEDEWPVLIRRLEDTGDWTAIDQAATPAPDSALAADQSLIDAHFGGETFRDILSALCATDSEWSRRTLERLSSPAPLAMAATVELIHRARMRDRIEDALQSEYRFAHRVAAQGDFREGIRAAIIERDKSPAWAHDAIDGATPAEVAAMLMPLGEDELKLEDAT